jgi:hypothetical protein
MHSRVNWARNEEKKGKKGSTVRRGMKGMWKCGKRRKA